jgi:hypothetical protein
MPWRLMPNPNTEPNIMVLVDLSRGGRTVTIHSYRHADKRNAEAIVEYLAGKPGALDDNNRILYQDNIGTWNGIAIKNGRFSGFVPIDAKTKAEAIDTARKKKKWRKPDQDFRAK